MQMKTQLEARALRYDGSSEIAPDDLARFLLLGVPPSKLRVHGTEEDIARFNEQVPPEDQLRLVQDEEVELDLSWQLPEPYRSMDLDTVVLNAYLERRDSGELDHGPKYQDAAFERMGAELEEVRARGLTEFMRTVLYVLARMREEGVVWGVGRGSSGASYILFLLGLHVVDCVLLEVPMEEFFH